MIGLLLACAAPEPSIRPTLVRASLDLRGVRPTLAEVEAFETEGVDAAVEAWLHDPRFADRVADLWSPVYGTRATEADWAEANYGIADERAFVSALGEEPLRVVAEVAAQDLPWPEVVTGDWTVIDERLAAWYPAAYPEGGRGWAVTRPTDGRPAAGVLATAGLWWRYQTTDTNANRGRANAVSRILLCNDYLHREVDFDGSLDLLDEAAIQDALLTEPACTSCHVSMDPLAGAFWGWAHEQPWSPDDLTDYNPERENAWETATGIAPAFYGRPLAGLADLGAAIADDPRFVECATEQATALLLQRPVTLAEDGPDLLVHREAFLAGGVTVRALFRSILASPAWRDGLPGAEPAPPRKVVTPAQLAATVEALTGYRATVDGHDVIGEDIWGLRSMAGGDHNQAGTDPPAVPNPSLVLVQERLALAAGAHVAAGDAAGPERRLLKLASFRERAVDRLAVEEQVAALWREVMLTEPELVDIDALTDLWTEVRAAEDDAVLAWGAVVAALLRRPELLVY